MARSGRGTGCCRPKTRIFHAFWTLAGPREVPVELPFGAKAVQFVLFTSAETEAVRPIFVSLWRVVAAIAALFQVSWRRKTGVGQSCPQHRLSLRSISVALRTRYLHTELWQKHTSSHTWRPSSASVEAM
ncbi:AHL_G0032660.mRNA.1.CDS.1 [Saccharomyces cerevisiae]|nr:CPG_1a_G0032560.mRNA.1.CDS.1 [Saccharomyces cerevisiae]CAI4589489.1 AIE_G0032410.mRNA.1.CDS.1 [Saccharomyces cerevisiae]CAI4602720.1 AVB_G0032790.mRNA.1.CDS.1 [Saccharomyces cerevisiae]CAI4889383.1 AHL_G0032660.mRNA.1.CDS.1 [Saccharomyces cerevisiae]CAI6764287.1 AIE_G0032410.mRNA.1.CDS.1 [Saccharomyces cerevisiae]